MVKHTIDRALTVIASGWLLTIVGRHHAMYVEERLGGVGCLCTFPMLSFKKFPASRAVSIEEKLRAEQESQRMQFVLMKERQEAERKRIGA